MAVNKRDVTRLPHHAASELCTTRAKYRQGKNLTAVKVADNCILQHYLIKTLMMIFLSLVDSFAVH
jgi:lipocalin